MSTGDPDDFKRRLYAMLPNGWFPALADAPVLGALLSGLASAWATVYALLAYARLQTRIATATDAFLDFISTDYFGRTLPRRNAETDTPFRRRILLEMLRPRGTRAALISVLQDLTGRMPIIFEPARATDTGGYGNQGMTMGTGLAYGLAGGYGSLLLPFQAFVHAFRPEGNGVANVGGFYTGSGWAGGGYGVGALEYVSPDMIDAGVTDEEINDAVARTMPVATIAWMNIQS